MHKLTLQVFLNTFMSVLTTKVQTSKMLNVCCMWQAGDMCMKHTALKQEAQKWWDHIPVHMQRKLGIVYP